MDFKDFFNSIDRTVIMNDVKQYITDEKLLNLIEYFVYDSSRDNGLDIGCHINQILALFACNRVDHLIKDKLRVEFFSRFVDDAIIIAPTREELLDILNKIEKIAALSGISINTKKTKINTLEHFNFLKKRITLRDDGKVIMRVFKETVYKFRKKIKKVSKTC